MLELIILTLGLCAGWKLNNVYNDIEWIIGFKAGQESITAVYIDELEAKYYKNKQDLRAFSIKHPESIFKLSGEGEESGDIWAEYYVAGKMQRCKAKILIPEFEPHLLK